MELDVDQAQQTQSTHVCTRSYLLALGFEYPCLYNGITSSLHFIVSYWPVINAHRLLIQWHSHTPGAFQSRIMSRPAKTSEYRFSPIYRYLTSFRMFLVRSGFRQDQHSCASLSAAKPHPDLFLRLGPNLSAPPGPGQLWPMELCSRSEASLQ